jgi:hypothetical protein
VSPQDIETWVIAAAAALAAFGYIVKQARRLFRTLDVLSAVVENELHHNGGKSMKDQTTQAAHSTARIEQQVTDLAELLNKHLRDPDAHRRSDA